MHNQLSDYFNDTFIPFLAAFRKGFGCKSTLLRLRRLEKGIGQPQVCSCSAHGLV